MNIQDKTITNTGKTMSYVKLIVLQDNNKAVTVTISTEIKDANGIVVQTIEQPLTTQQVNQLMAGQFTIPQARTWFLQQNNITEI